MQSKQMTYEIRGFNYMEKEKQKMRTEKMLESRRTNCDN